MVPTLILMFVIIPKLFASNAPILLISYTATRPMVVSSSNSLFLLDMGNDVRFRIEAFDFLFDSPVPSPNGDQYAILADRDIYLMNPNTLAIRQLTYTKDMLEFHLNWSPDGSKLSATLTQPIVNMGDVIVINIDSGITQNLTDTPDQNEIVLDWSPDTSTLLYAVPDDSTSTLYLIDQDGNNRRRLHEGYLGEWSPDGRFVVSVTGAGLLLAKPTGQFQQIFPLTYVYYWSNTGRYLTTVHEDAIVIHELSKSTRRTLIETQQLIGQIDWSFDDMQMAFTLGDDIYVTTATGEPINLTQTPEQIESSPRWSQDNQYIAYQRWDAVCTYQIERSQEICRALMPGRTFNVIWFQPTQ